MTPRRVTTTTCNTNDSTGNRSNTTNMKQEQHDQESRKFQTPIIPDELIVILLELLPNNNNNNNNNSSIHTNALVVVATPLMNEKNHNNNTAAATVRPDDGHRWRLRIIDSIVTLHKLLNQYQKIKAVSSSSSLEMEQSLPPQHENEVEEDLLLLQIEPHMIQLRMDLHQFTTVIIPHEYHKIQMYQEQIILYQSQQHQQPMIYYYIMRILLSQHEQQLQREEQMLMHTLYPTLDAWYDHDESTNNNNNNVQLHLQWCIQTLCQPLWTNQQQYMYDMIELLLEQIRQQQQQELVMNDDNQIASRTTMMSLSSFQTKQHHYNLPVKSKNSCDDLVHMKEIQEIDHDGIMTTEPILDHSTDWTSSTITTTASLAQKMIHESFHFIYRTPNHHDNSSNNKNNVTTILIIGSVGSGKTYICNQLEKQLSLSTRSTTLGMKMYICWNLRYYNYMY